MEKKTYYVSSGELNRMHTLRVRFPETMYASDGEGGSTAYEVIRDWHIVNLSTDWDTAVEKAKAHAEAAEGRYSEGEKFELGVIRNRTPEEIEADRLAAEAVVAKVREEAEERERAWRADKLDFIVAGKWPYGRYAGEKFDKADEGYIVYWLELEIEGDDVIAESLKNALAAHFPHLANIPKPNESYFGEIKKRYTVTVTPIASFSFEGYYGRCYVEKYVSEGGELLVYKGGAPKGFPLGKPVKIVATVKDHDEYKGEKFTAIIRIKENRK